MAIFKIKKLDRVKLSNIGTVDHSKKIYINIKSKIHSEDGSIGRVLDISKKRILIEFDMKHSRFHNGNGLGKYFHCYWVDINEIERARFNEVGW